jgi:hypothetical protein
MSHRALNALGVGFFLLSLTHLAPGESFAQSPAANQTAENKLILAFRLQDWYAKHIHDADQAKKHADTLKQLGCEVKTVEHNGHIDVQARTVLWKSLALTSHAQVHEWQNWLQLAGFDTIHGHAAEDNPQKNADGTPKEIVKYRLSDWRSQHVHQPQEVGQLTTLYRALNCELETAEHAGHTDLKIRCPEWMEVELPNHDAAHKWMDFLKKAGFETSHEH